jgi:hypothetical protein
MPSALQSSRPAWLLPVALLGALLLLWLGCIVTYVVSLPASEAVAAEELAQRAPAEPALLAAKRCAQCGWIQSKQEVLPQLYEYTVRMIDGTTRVFREPLPTSWRVGERILVIDGTGKPN